MPPEPLTLIFDTSGPFCAVALLRGDALAASRVVEPMATGQSEHLFPMIAEVLADADATLADITRIVVATGPGNFTGTRIGVAAARGLALSTGVPCVGVSRLQALGTDGTAAVAAYKGHAYAQEFAGGVATGDPVLVTLDVLSPQGALRTDATLAEAGLSATLVPRAEVLLSMGRIGLAQPADAPPPAPLYLRAPDAALPADPPPVILP